VTREIPLTNGGVALVDDEDYALVMSAAPTWWAHIDTKTGRRFYARRSRAPLGQPPRPIFMHQIITGYSLTDHINGDGFDNRRANLREASHQQNCWNVTLRGLNTSGYKGVDFHKGTGKWRARIRTAEGRLALGYYYSPITAAQVYDAAARDLHGEFARLNFPRVGERGAA
jgi:hypothetical protein